MDTKVKAILDWMANERLANECCGYVEKYYSSLISLLAEQFSINKDELRSYFEEEFDSIEETWSSELEVQY